MGNVLMQRIEHPSLLDVLGRWRARSGDRAAVHHLGAGRSLRYGDLSELAVRIAARLHASGVAAGDRVVVVFEDHWAVMPLLVASAINGSVLVPVSPAVHSSVLRHVLKETRPKLVLAVEPAALDVPARHAPESLDAYLSDLPARAPLVEERASPASTEPLLVIYTSGTTGEPKGVVLTEENLVVDASGIARTYRVGPGDRLLSVMPQHHMNGMMITGVMPLLAGATVVVSEPFRFQAAKAYLRLVREHRITVLSLIPSIMAVLEKLFPAQRLADDGVRFALCGTAPLLEPLWRSFEGHFGIPVYQGYGLTETTCWATLVPPVSEHRYDAVGVPVNCEVRIEGAGAAPGEILLRGPIVTPGYFGRKSPLQDGWFRTGDLGYVDEDGQLVIAGRLKDTIIRYGNNLHPSEIDRVLARNPGVAESATVGVPDEVAGEAVHTAWTAAAEDAAPSDRELRGWLAERISEGILPDRLHRFHVLPRNAVGKVDRKRLRRVITGEAAAAALDAIDTRKWLRYHAERDQVLPAIHHALVHGEPVRFVKYWGASDKAQPDELDRCALERVDELLREIDQHLFYGIELTLLFTDMHYRINGFPPEVTDGYTRGIAEMAHGFGFATVPGSDIWNSAGLTLEQVECAAGTPEALVEWQALPFRDELVMQAGRHGQNGKAERLARLYYFANKLEREVFARRFERHIFLTYNRDSQDDLLPALPKLYIHSYKSKTSEKPWFAAAK